MAVLTEDQTMLRDMAQSWTDKESPVAAFRALRDAAPAAGFDAAVWAEIGQMGWPGIVVPEGHGGAGMGYLSLGLVLEQLGRTLTATPLAATAPAASAIATGEDAQAQRDWLPRIAGGEAIVALAVDEGPLHDPAALTTTVADGRLSGTKTFVAEGDGAHAFVVAATDGLYLVADGTGVTRTPRRVADSRSHADIRFDAAPATRLGGPDRTAAACDRATALVAAEMLGLANQAFDDTNAYLKTRVQFGQPLSSFQALQHRMAKMFTELELMRSVVEAALEAIDAGRADVAQAVSLAKALGGETTKLVSREMVQLHGGIGMTDEHHAGLYLKRAAVLEAMWGNAAWHRDRFGRLAGY